MIEGLIFDSDDTIFNTSRISAKNLQWGLQRFNQETGANYPIITPEQSLAVHASTWTEWMQFLLGDDKYEAFIEFYNTIRHEQPHTIHPIQGAIEAVSRTREMVKSQGIVTSSYEESLLKKFRNAGVNPEELFDFWFTLDNNPYRKPDPRALEPGIQIMWDHGIPLSRIRYVGDSTIDHRCAVAAEIGFSGVLTGQQAHELKNLAMQRDDIRLPSIKHIPNYVEIINKA